MSPASPKPWHPEQSNPNKPFDIEQHQIDNFKDGGRRDSLWEFLEGLEFEARMLELGGWKNRAESPRPR
jgi:hypothetical protein